MWDQATCASLKNQNSIWKIQNSITRLSKEGLGNLHSTPKSKRPVSFSYLIFTLLQVWVLSKPWCQTSAKFEHNGLQFWHIAVYTFENAAQESLLKP